VIGVDLTTGTPRFYLRNYELRMESVLAPVAMAFFGSATVLVNVEEWSGEASDQRN